MKTLTTLTIALLCTFSACAAPKNQPSFREDGTFRILQLTDLHMQSQHPSECEKVFARMDSLVKWEQPDFITITGDLLYSWPAADLLRSIVDKLDSFQKPWAVVYGNHDAEQGLSRPDMSAIIASGKYTVNTLNEAGELSDIEVAVMDGKAPAYYLYFMDSHDYSSDPEIPGYAWFSEQQVAWLAGSVEARRHADGSTEPSLAFFHIPLCEYVDACLPNCNPAPGTKSYSLCWGNIGESVACARHNSGMFDAMLKGGSITGVFCGHDHDNDFIAAYKGIALAYGKFSGTDCEYNDITKGGRVIVLTRGNRYFETWLRDDDGRYIRRCRFDGNKIVLPKWKDGYQLYGTLTEFE